MVNAVSVRKQRPFRAVTGGDDRTLIFSHGVPFKYAKTLNEHTGFVQDVAFSVSAVACADATLDPRVFIWFICTPVASVQPSGDHFASVGADGKLLLYDGSSGDFVSALTSEHKGTIFALSWSADSRSISTSGANKTVKIWDVEKQMVTQSWTVGDGVEHQQVGNAWSSGPNEEIVSLSFGGNLNVLDKRTGDRPAKILYGREWSIWTDEPFRAAPSRPLESTHTERHCGHRPEVRHESVQQASVGCYLLHRVLRRPCERI